MDKELFNDVGKDIKQLAAVITRLITVCYVLIALAVVAVGITASVLSERGWACLLSILIAVIVIIYGYIKVRLQAITMYAYGELVEKTKSIEDILSGGKRKNSPTKSRQQKSEKNSEDSYDAQNTENIPMVKREEDGSWDCVFCDHHNPAGADWCEKCGVQAKIQ